MKKETAKEILDQWKRVQADRAERKRCLERTGPGESPYTATQEFAWDMREQCLSITLLAAMPELESVVVRYV